MAIRRTRDSEGLLIQQLFRRIRQSFFLSLACFGVVLITIGSMLGLGVVPGMLGIVGITCTVLGSVSYVTLRYIRGY